ncbi:hypothetical protein [Streptomyces sp. NPDC006863]
MSEEPRHGRRVTYAEQVDLEQTPTSAQEPRRKYAAYQAAPPTT